MTYKKRVNSVNWLTGDLTGFFQLLSSLFPHFKTKDNIYLINWSMLVSRSGYFSLGSFLLLTGFCPPSKQNRGTKRESNNTGKCKSAAHILNEGNFQPFSKSWATFRIHSFPEKSCVALKGVRSLQHQFFLTTFSFFWNIFQVCHHTYTWPWWYLQRRHVHISLYASGHLNTQNKKMSS